MGTPRDTYDLALADSAMGLRFVPGRPGTKVPLVRWKPFQAESPTPDLYERWFRGARNNIGVLTNGMVVSDADDPAKAALVVALCGGPRGRWRPRRAGCTWGTGGGRAWP